MASWPQDTRVFQGFCGASAEDLPGSVARMRGVYRTPESDACLRRSRMWGMRPGFYGAVARVFLGFNRGSPGDSLGICSGLTRPSKERYSFDAQAAP
jgi:hypothetical protein